MRKRSLKEELKVEQTALPSSETSELRFASLTSLKQGSINEANRRDIVDSVRRKSDIQARQSPPGIALLSVGTISLECSSAAGVKLIYAFSRAKSGGSGKGRAAAAKPAALQANTDAGRISVGRVGCRDCNSENGYNCHNGRHKNQ